MIMNIVKKINFNSNCWNNENKNKNILILVIYIFKKIKNRLLKVLYF